MKKSISKAFNPHNQTYLHQGTSDRSYTSLFLSGFSYEETSRCNLFSKKTVMITGAAGNLGRAVADSFEANGANLVLIDLNSTALEQAYPEETKNHFKCAINLLNIKEIIKLVESATERLHAIRIQVLKTKFLPFIASLLSIIPIRPYQCRN